MFVSNFTSLLCRFGVPAKDLPHPDVDWQAFYDQIYALNEKTPMVWSSATKAPARWINMVYLTSIYGPLAERTSIYSPPSERKAACCIIN